MFKPGVSGNPAGKPKGLPHKKTQALQKMLADLGCDPAEGLARLALEARADGDRDMEHKCYNSLLAYTYPRLKQVDVTHSGDGGISLKVVTKAHDETGQVIEHDPGPELPEPEPAPDIQPSQEAIQAALRSV